LPRGQARGAAPARAGQLALHERAPQAEESDRQVAVVEALGLDDLSLLHADDDLDLIGQVARC